MNCKLCGNEEINISYHGVIRNGGLGKYTTKPVSMYHCNKCGIIWHEPIHEAKEYYESQEYRQSLEGTSDENEFYRLHDKESMDKFRYTGTEIFRNKIVADIGCGAGAFMDYVSGVATKVVAIEPSETYRSILDRKGFCTYPYASDALKQYGDAVDVVVSFDVIEHVEKPKTFLQEVYKLLKSNGKAVIGTPTDAPVMRSLLGEEYERKQLFSTQHLWVFSENNLKMLAEEIGFHHIEIKFFQRYGFDNMLGWIRDKKPRSEVKGEFVDSIMDSVWKSSLERKGLSDYIVLYMDK